jgi:hypothetical protein
VAFVINDRVKETSTTTGTGTLSLAGAVSGFDSFSAGIGNANSTYYAIVGGAEWEVGIGTYTLSGSTLSRTTVLSSSNADALVNFSAGTKDVFVTAAASKLMTTDQLHEAASKSTPVDADELPILDSAVSFILKRLTWANIKATLKAFFDGLYLFKLTDIDASVSANALTATINAGTFDFRSTTLTDGTPVSRALASAISLVVPNTATLGMVNGILARLILLAIDNAGTVEPAIVNYTGGVNLDESSLINTTALSTGSDSANVIYSTVARTGVAFKIVGYIDISCAAIGVYASNPTLVQAAGGQALVALTSIGNSVLQDLVGSRAINTTYTNTSGKAKEVKVSISSNSSGQINLSFLVNGVIRTRQLLPVSASGFYITATVLVPNGATYSVDTTASSSTPTLQIWQEG